MAHPVGGLDDRRSAADATIGYSGAVQRCRTGCAGSAAAGAGPRLPACEMRVQKAPPGPRSRRPSGRRPRAALALGRRRSGRRRRGFRGVHSRALVERVIATRVRANEQRPIGIVRAIAGPARPTRSAGPCPHILPDGDQPALNSWHRGRSRSGQRPGRSGPKLLDSSLAIVPSRSAAASISAASMESGGLVDRDELAVGNQRVAQHTTDLAQAPP